MKKFRVFSKISSASYPPGTSAPKPMLFSATDARAAELMAAKAHRSENKFPTVSEWSAVEERA